MINHKDTGLQSVDFDKVSSTITKRGIEDFNDKLSSCQFTCIPSMSKLSGQKPIRIVHWSRLNDIQYACIDITLRKYTNNHVAFFKITVC